MILVTTRQSTVMVNSGETAHLSCSVQAIFFTITIPKIILTTPLLILKMILALTSLPCRTVRRSTAWSGGTRLETKSSRTEGHLCQTGRSLIVVLRTLMYSLYLIVGFYSILIPNSLSPIIQTLVLKPPNWSGSSSKVPTFWSAKLVGLTWEGEAWNEKMQQISTSFSTQVHMYGPERLWSGHGFQLPLPACPGLLWLQPIIRGCWHCIQKPFFSEILHNFFHQKTFFVSRWLLNCLKAGLCGQKYSCAFMSMYALYLAMVPYLT